MELLIVSGLSGAGKSVAMNALEDIGYFCIDNIPVALLPRIVDFALQGENQLNRVAVVMDVRGVRSIEKLQEALAERLERRGMAPQQAAAEAGKLAYILWSAVTAPKGVQSDIVRQMTADSLDELFPPQ